MIFGRELVVEEDGKWGGSNKLRNCIQSSNNFYHHNFGMICPLDLF